MNHRSYLALAIPLTISTITTPLIGAVDTAVVGQLPNWLAFTVFSLGRSVFLALYIPWLSKKLFPNGSVRLENDQMV
ncbi:hypothetical protein [Peribacillus simplex]|uniref:hypothetical protein n=1 Tax=Peribacillus simplex TaxID=1478 RepID=UPI003D9C0829